MRRSIRIGDYTSNLATSLSAQASVERTSRGPFIAPSGEIIHEQSTLI